jgi:uncharacterized protein
MSVNKTAIVQKLFEICAAGQWDVVEQYLHPDFEAVPAPSQPYADVFRGLEGFRRLFSKVFVETYDRFDVEVLEFAEGPKRVVAIGEATITGKNTGRTVKMTLAEVFEFEGDKLRSIRPHYHDTKLLIEL